MVIAIVALVAALGGTAIGAAFVTKKQAKKIAKNQVNKLAPGLSVASAKNADNANNANALGGTAAGGYPKVTQFAYALINANATVSPEAPNRGIVSVAPGPITGVYCLDLAFTPSFAQISGTGASGTHVHFLVDIPESNCPPTSEATVYVTNNTGTFINDDFQVLFGGF